MHVQACTGHKINNSPAGRRAAALNARSRLQGDSNATIRETGGPRGSTPGDILDRHEAAGLCEVARVDPHAQAAREAAARNTHDELVEARVVSVEESARA